MAEDANPNNYPERYVRVRGLCECDEPTHYITLDRGPVSLTAPPPVQLEQKTNSQYRDQQEQVKSQLPATAPCRFSSPPRLSSSPPAQLVTRTPAPAYHAKPLALFQRFTIPEPAQFHFASPPAALPPPRCQHNPLPTQLPSAMSSPLSNPPPNPLPTHCLVTSPPAVTAHRVTNPPLPPPPPKRQRKKTEKFNRKCKKSRRAVKLIKQPNFHDESGSQGNAGLEGGVPGAVDEARSTRACMLVDVENARLAAAIRAQLSTPVPGSIGGGVVPGGDAWRPRHQPKTLAGARLAAALADRRRAKLLIGLQHLGIP